MELEESSFAETAKPSFYGGRLAPEDRRDDWPKGWMGSFWVGQFSGRPKDSLRRPRNGTQFLTDLSV
jgi:hypothetical protein